jgi:hypothetical protein
LARNITKCYPLAMPAKIIFYLACVPVEVCPTLPEEVTYSTYKVVNCPDCGKPMWLGVQGEKLVAQGRKAVCMFCLVVLMKKEGITDMTVVTLTGKGKP